MAKNNSNKAENDSAKSADTNVDATDQEIDKSQTIEEAMEQSEKTEPDQETKDMLSAESEIDDDVLAETSNHLNDKEADSTRPPKSKRNYKKILKVFVILLVIAGLAASAWYFLINKKDTPAPSSQENQAVESQNNSENTYAPDAVVYAYRPKDNAPDTIYWRPAEGGDRTDIRKLDKDEYLTHYDAYKNVVVYSTTKGIFASTDGGRTFSQIKEIKGGNSSTTNEDITSLKISKEGDSLAYAFLSNGSTSSSVVIYRTSLDGNNQEELFKSKRVGVFIEAWTSAKNKMVYWDGCYYCDGNTINLKLRDLQANTEKLVSKDIEKTVYDSTSFAVSKDFSSLVAAQGTPSDNPDDFGPGLFLKAPFSIVLYDLNDLGKSTLATVGKAGETSKNGTEKFRNVLAGFVANSSDVYYTDDNQVYVVENGDPSLTLTTKDNIIYLPFIGENNIITGAGKQNGDYNLTNYNRGSQKTDQIFVGDTNTVIIGVSTK